MVYGSVLDSVALTCTTLTSLYVNSLSQIAQLMMFSFAQTDGELETVSQLWTKQETQLTSALFGTNNTVWLKTKIKPFLRQLSKDQLHHLILLKIKGWFTNHWTIWYGLSERSQTDPHLIISKKETIISSYPVD